MSLSKYNQVLARQLKEATGHGLVGKTIEKIHLGTKVDGQVVLIFTDQTFVVIHADVSPHDPAEALCRISNYLSAWNMEDIGLLTRKEHQAYRRTMHARDLRRLGNQQKERDAKELDRLKKLYPEKFK